MPEVTFTDWEGTSRTLPAKDGDKIMQLATRNGVPGIVGECGGVLSCATCHVFVDPAQADLLPKMSELENELLDGTAVDRQENSRLACQITAPDSIPVLCVSTPEYQD